MWGTALKVLRAAAPLAFGSVMLCTAGPTVPLDAPLTTTFPFGLTGPGTTHRYYTTALDMHAPVLKRGSGDFMAAARLDARERLGLPQSVSLSAEETLAVEASVREHLSTASCKSSAFLCSSMVPGREEITAAIVMGVFQNEGELALFLGGKNTGKSKLLSVLARRTDIVGFNGTMRVVLYVDARQFNKNLAAGLQAALLGESKGAEVGWGGWAWLRGEERSRRSKTPQEIQSDASSASLAAILRDIGLKATDQVNLSKNVNATEMEVNAEMLARVVALAEERGLYVCLVVDEANLALFPTPNQRHQGPEQQRLLYDTQVFLQRLIQLTKENKRMSALLVSSEHALPYRLHQGCFFNPTNLTAVLFGGEVPPADMRTLMQDTWGLDPRLSDVFLAFYGGHVHMASQALRNLAYHLDDFKCFSVAPDGAAGATAAALGSGNSSKERIKARVLLRSVAQRGFAPVSEEGDSCAQALARANLGGLVKCESLVVGLPKSVRGDSSFGFVPSSQFLRNLIARDLYNEGKARGWLKRWY